MIRRVALALILGGVVATNAEAQAPPTATPVTPPVPPVAPVASPGPATSTTAKQAADDVPPPPPRPAALPANRPIKVARQQPRAVNPNDGRALLAAEGRFANPGGVGRYSEYYTPFTPMTRYQGPPTRPAGFGQGGGPTRADQVAAFRAGQLRTQNIQNNLNAYGQPLGFGIGIGYGIGFGRGFGGLR